MFEDKWMFFCHCLERGISFVKIAHIFHIPLNNCLEETETERILCRERRLFSPIAPFTFSEELIPLGTDSHTHTPIERIDAYYRSV